MVSGLENALYRSQDPFEVTDRYRYVCARVPKFTRVTGVSFFHYSLLADLPVPKLKRLALRVLKHNWTVAKLRQELRRLSRAAIVEEGGQVGEILRCTVS